jgi:hypothetical protein
VITAAAVACSRRVRRGLQRRVEAIAFEEGCIRVGILGIEISDCLNKEFQLLLQVIEVSYLKD